ncbi:MAG: hypothetical protein IZT59_13835 [Verrucomicrobia bacterium]|nr:hypothetical protein [Verrucomicrobiota bacterium]
MSDSLFQPLKAGASTLPNRIVMASLMRFRSSDGRVANELMAEYYTGAHWDLRFGASGKGGISALNFRSSSL